MSPMGRPSPTREFNSQFAMIVRAFKRNSFNIAESGDKHSYLSMQFLVRKKSGFTPNISE